MSGSGLPAGKLPASMLRALLESRAPLPAEVLLGPKVGEDACAIDVPAGVLVAATDPITLTGEGVGAHAVVINANDVAVMGVRPRWFLAVVLLPVGVEEPEIHALFDGIERGLESVGASLVGGHTEVTPVVSQPVVVGQMLGLREDGRFVRTGGMAAGDQLLQVGPAALEGAAVLAAEARERLQNLPRGTLESARAGLEVPGLSIVEQALIAAECGACALHDPTEGGLSAGLFELADASEVGLSVDPDQVLWFEPAREICGALGADPWGTLASGTLLAGFARDRIGSARERLEDNGFAVRQIGHAEQGSGVRTVSGAPLARFDRDEVSRVLSYNLPPGGEAGKAVR